MRAYYSIVHKIGGETSYRKKGNLFKIGGEILWEKKGHLNIASVCI